MATKRCDVNSGSSVFDADIQGKNTPANLAQATATAAMVPVCTMAINVQP